MPYAPWPSVPRRGFLFRLSQATAAFSALLLDPRRLGAAVPPVPRRAPGDPDAWMSHLTREQKVMIHVHQYFMTALIDARNMLANARDQYGVPEEQFSLAVVTHGPAIQGLLSDGLWQRFALGEFYKVNDPKTSAPSTRNFFLQAQDGEPPDATVSDLIRRGVTFVVCNVALRNLSRRLAREGASAESIHPELAAGLVPGTFLVPDVFVSMQRAQKRGIAYIFTDRPPH